MAEGKNSFVLYCDLIHTVRKMPRELRGDLFLHILQYVNDENPVADDPMVEIAFEPIKWQLKRDLKKYERKRESKSVGGRVGNLKRWHTDLYEKYKAKEITLEHAEFIASDRKTSHSDDTDRIASHSIAKIAVNDSVNVNGNVSTKVDSDSAPVGFDKNKYLMMQIINNQTEHQTWIETYYRKFKLANKKLGFALEQFNDSLVGNDIIHSTLKDYKKHFFNWMNSQEAKGNLEPLKR